MQCSSLQRETAALCSLILKRRWCSFWKKSFCMLYNLMCFQVILVWCGWWTQMHNKEILLEPNFIALIDPNQVLFSFLCFFLLKAWKPSLFLLMALKTAFLIRSWTVTSVFLYCMKKKHSALCTSSDMTLYLFITLWITAADRCSTAACRVINTKSVCFFFEAWFRF